MKLHFQKGSNNSIPDAFKSLLYFVQFLNSVEYSGAYYRGGNIVALSYPILPNLISLPVSKLIIDPFFCLLFLAPHLFWNPYHAIENEYVRSRTTSTMFCCAVPACSRAALSLRSVTSLPTWSWSTPALSWSFSSLSTISSLFSSFNYHYHINWFYALAVIVIVKMFIATFWIISYFCKVQIVLR